MKQKIYQVDAFTDRLFAGNPAAVCILDKPFSDELMQNIANENNLSETAFVVKKKDIYEIRWFTPLVEVNLCGHATLAAAYVIFHYHETSLSKINFSSKSGLLSVTRNLDLISLNFPTYYITPVEISQDMACALGDVPVEAYMGKTDLLLVFKNQKQIEEMKPAFDLLLKVKARGIIVSAPGDRSDFVSRFFCPAVGINEDPVTGSAHTMLAPYWGKRLNKTEMTAIQLSKRKGFLSCKLSGDRVEIAGKAMIYSEGDIFLKNI